jgi:hypothetical protein
MINLVTKLLAIDIVLELGRVTNLVYGQALKTSGDAVFPVGDSSKLQHNIDGEKLCDKIYHLYIIREDPHNVVT